MTCGSTRRKSLRGLSWSKSSRPIEATICRAELTVFSWYWNTRCFLSSTTRARARVGSCVATPTGHVLVWHVCAWMHPIANIMARADIVKSAPWQMRLTMSMPVATLPLAPILTWWRSPTPTRALCTNISASVRGMPTWSSNSTGPAPVPPSEPSTMMKSGALPRASIALQIARNSRREPMQILKPTGLPPLRSRSRSMKSTSPSGVENSGCTGGETTVVPIGTPRAAATSALTLAPGSRPPSPGLAPWEILMLMALTCSSPALAAKAWSSKRPSGVRQPK